MRSRLTRTAVVVAGLAVAFSLAFFVSPHASSSPDGLEKVAADHALDTATTSHAMHASPVADYSLRGVHSPSLSTGLAGIIGVAVTFVVALGALRLARRLGRRPPHPVTPDHAGASS